MSASWENGSHPARFETQREDGTVQCGLSPRHCLIREGGLGFCRVRANRGGRLVSLNYGKAVHATEEVIETEAIHHFNPGSRILSMGNVGCMFNCDYCQNWKTSQARYLDAADVVSYTPQEVVDIALRHGIGTISWTYNDPVVWHEFVMETATLARDAGLLNLYKSAFFITPEAIEELLSCIDIFSISLKSIDPQYYRRLTKGWLEPVLDGLELVYRSGTHLEVSTLMVTDISDDEETAERVAGFVIDKLGPEVPLHFVRFHPDYKMRDTVRTPIPRLERAQQVAREVGIHHVYLGNVFGHAGSNTFCRHCEALQIERFGLMARTSGIDGGGSCRGCGAPSDVTFRPPTAQAGVVTRRPAGGTATTHRYLWRGDIRSLHLQLRNDSHEAREILVRGIDGGEDDADDWRVVPLQGRESFRIMLSKSDPDERGVAMILPEGVSWSEHEVFDRAHFPTVDASSGTLNGDVSPLPMYNGNLVKIDALKSTTRTERSPARDVADG